MLVTSFITAVVLVSLLALLAGCSPATLSKSCTARAATHVAATQLANSTAGPCPWAAQEQAEGAETELPSAEAAASEAPE